MAVYQNITPLQISQAALTTSYVTLYTVPTDYRTYLKQFDICNTTSGAITVYISIVPSGGTAGTSNALFYNTSIPAYTVVQWTGSQVMLTDSTLQAKASASGLTLTVSGGAAI
jgi:hypothetical protein